MPGSAVPEVVDDWLTQMSLDDVRTVLKVVGTWLASEAEAGAEAAREAQGQRLFERADKWDYVTGAFWNANWHVGTAADAIKDITLRAGRKSHGTPT